MTIIQSEVKPLTSLPDDLDMYGFLFEHWPSYRYDPRGTGQPLLIDEGTGQRWTFEECQQRVDDLAVALRTKLGVVNDTVVAIYSANNVDYIVAILACHKIGAIVSCANPAYQPSELSFQLEASKSTVMFVGEEAYDAGLTAALQAKIPADKVIVMQTPATCQARGALKGGAKRTDKDAWTLEGLVSEGQAIVQRHGASAYAEGRARLGAGQARAKLAFLSFSSGTTGLPKGVMIPHYAPISNVQQMSAYNNLINSPSHSPARYRPGKDVSLGGLPFYHIYGLVIGLLWTFYTGITNVVVAKFKGIEALIKTTLKYRITLWWLVPPQVVLLVKDPSVKPYLSELRGLVRALMIGAAPLSDDLSSQLEKTLPGIDWGQGYGMTECSTLVSMYPPGLKPVLGSAGRLVTNVEACVVDPQGKRVPVGETGELWIRSPSVTLGYLNNEKATQEMWVGDGWLRTGDEVKFNEEGDMFILDRLKELIKVKGFQVAPAELEGFILGHEDVADVGVIGLPDEASGEIPLAFIALSEGAKQRLAKAGSARAAEEDKVRSEVMKLVADNKIKYKHLAGVVIIDAIPKNPSGKLLRRQLRDMAKQLPPLEKRGQGKL
ncbi:unnamed protein product [Parajaminaea phylloscopi]